MPNLTLYVCFMSSKSNFRYDAWRTIYEYFQQHHRRTLHDLTESGLSVGDVKSLMSLQPGHPVTMRELADAWQCDASTVTWIIDRLDEAGYVERRQHETDRRAKTVTLTERGQSAREQALKLLYQPPKAFLDLTETDANKLLALVERLSE